MKKVDFLDLARASDDESREAALLGLLARMSLWEKIKQVHGSANLLDLLIMPFRYNHRAYPSGENHRLKIPPLLFTDGPRGVGIGSSTCFPVAMARGASWDIDLEERVATAMGIEARAQGANFFAGVCINIPRHPAWGRSQETFGEASHLLAEMAVADIRGLQRHVMACVKHFACNSMEEARFRVDVQIAQDVLHETYLPHFKRAIEAGAAAVMSAYNQVNGHYCGHNRELLQETLKNAWGFEGLVMSDFMLGVWSPEAIKNGLDVEMPFAIQFARRLFFRVKSGRIAQSHLDQAVRRVLKTKARFYSLIEKEKPPPKVIACPAHRKLARESSAKSMVLLKNSGRLLPLRREKLKRIALLGPWSDKPNLGDRGSSRVRPPYTATVLDGLREFVGDDIEVLSYSGQCLATARAFAERADVAIIVVGLSWKEEGEYLPIMEMGGDRSHLRLPDAQESLLLAVSQKSTTPCVVVLQAGGALIMENWRESVDAILMTWYPGMEGGRATIDLLFGKTEPQGRLPITFPRAESQLPPFDKAASEIVYEAYHGYRWFEHKQESPAFSLGFGLSYTEFRYGDAQFQISEDERQIDLSITVENVGDRPGQVLILVFWARVNTDNNAEPAKLCAFSRTEIKQGGREILRFCIGRPQSYLSDKKQWARHLGPFRMRIGQNAAEYQEIDIPAVPHS